MKYLHWTIGFFSLLFIMLNNSYARNIATPIIFIQDLNNSVKSSKIKPWLKSEIKLVSGGLLTTSLNGEKQVGLSTKLFNVKGDYYFIQFKNRVSSINDQVKQIRKSIKYLRNQLKVNKFILVGFGMGGLSARSYLLYYPNNHFISRLVTVATPHNGTIFATLLEKLHTPIKKKCANNASKYFLCKLPKKTIEWLSGFSFKNEAFKDLMPKRLKILGKRKHPLNLEYVSIIGEFPNIGDTETYISFFKEVLDGSVNKKVNPLTSEIIDGLRRLIEQAITKNDTGKGNGIVSISSQDMSELAWFKSRRNLIYQYPNQDIPNYNIQYHAYKFGLWNDDGYMETYKVKGAYHLDIEQNKKILWRAILGQNYIKKVNYKDDNTLIVYMKGYSYIKEYFQLVGRSKDNKSIEIPIKVGFYKGKVSIHSKNNLNNFKELYLKYSKSSSRNNIKISSKYFPVKRDNYIIIIIFVFIVIILFFFFFKKQSRIKKSDENWGDDIYR